MILVMMGVSGAGKTTIGSLLASHLGWIFADADDYHPEQNKKKMHAGIPLNDEDRVPWLQRLHQLLVEWDREGKSGILACSALKASYRKILAEELSHLRFVFLDVSRETLAHRLGAREGHFMNPGLLDSQLNTLELPTEALHIVADEEPQKVVDSILLQLKA